MIPLTVPELRRLLLALTEPAEQFSFRLAWSHWRRRHQAVARRGHVARRARRLAASPAAVPLLPVAPAALGPAVLTSALSAAEWARILPLLPPEKPRRGRRRYAQQQVVAAMLWVERTGASWRQVPAHLGPWHRAYQCYRAWRGSGLWARILAALEPGPVAALSTSPAHAPPDARVAA